MADNLKITTPINSNENISKIRPKEQPGNINVVDPTRVNSRNDNEQTGKQGVLDFRFNSQSVYNKFLEQLLQTPGLNDTLKKILFDAFLRKGNANFDNRLDSLLNIFASKLQMNEPEMMTEQIKYLVENNTKFTGDLFNMLRDLQTQAKQSNDKELTFLIGRFLKSYDNLFSAKDTVNAILYTLKNMTLYMRKSSTDTLEKFITQLEKSIKNQDTAQSIILLKNEIIPFLSKYILSTNDLGKIRDMITLLVHNMARLNAGSKEGVTDDFSNLLDYCKYNLNLRNSHMEALETAFKDVFEKPQNYENENFKSLIEIIKKGITDNSSTISKAMYKDIANALLLDHSTFMPLIHIFLPINYNGVFMFSEIWIDKDQQNSNRRDRANNQENNLRLFITFDIQNLGFFETIIQLSGQKAAVSINYPIPLKSKDKEIKDTINSIFTNQGFELIEIGLTAGYPAQNLDQVFPNLYERNQSINVSV